MKMKKIILQVLLLIVCLAAKAYDDVGIKISVSSGDVMLASPTQRATIVVSSEEKEVVREVATSALSSDMNQLTGHSLDITAKVPSGNCPLVVVGTLGTSSLIEQIVKENLIDIKSVEGQWETFGLQTTTWKGHSTLVIFGSDPRGTAYGVFELSRAMGVTPYVWWADVTPTHKDKVYVSCDKVVVGPPSVKYRGLFINDEDWGLQPWAARHMDTDLNDIGPRTYEKFFELLLRLKGNYCWPGMHPCTKAFWYYKDNPKVARRYDIVMGSSHCEPLLRNNVDEWQNNFKEEYGTASGAWNWKTNSSTITTYWTDRVKESRNTDAIYTIGMRGIHDSSMPGYSTNEEKRAGLKDVIGVQRKILANELGKSASEVPQIFCPYKEALTLYRLGLDLPEDVTLCWADDNFGYVRQLSNAEEQKRSGGGGVYYHFSYWGIPYDHLWLGSVSPTLTSYELTKAYDLNCKNVWVFNVGDVKPHEIETQFAMDFAWNVKRWSPEKAQSYMVTWATEYFGSEIANEIARVKNEYYRLAASGKPEHVHVINFTREEVMQRLKEYMQLEEDVEALRSQVPDNLKDAFYEMVYYPCMGAANINKKVLFAKMSNYAAQDGNATMTTEYGALAMHAYNKIVGLTNEYNNIVAGGKWEGMMDYAPRALSYFYAPKVASKSDVVENPVKAPADHEIEKICAARYTATGNSSNIKLIDGLGITDTAMTVLPLNMTAYTSDDITSAPYLEYDVPVTEGINTITVKCLPTFPLYSEYKLRFAVSIAGATSVFHDITMQAEASPWSTNVMTGYSYGTDSYVAATSGTVKVRVYLADPGVVLSEIQVKRPSAYQYVEGLVNAGFEYKSEGVLNNGATTRGDVYGWTRTGTISGNSYGLSADATNYEGSSICWYNSKPMPKFFQLSQTIKGLPAGNYRVRCKLGVFTDQVTNQRLFANNNVQYYGPESDYVNNLVEGENNTFAGHAYGVKNGKKSLLNEMYVDVTIAEGEDLTVGIRSSNTLSDGTAATDNAGWFKVDDFRIQNLSQEAEKDDATEKEVVRELLKKALSDNGIVPSANVGNAAFQYSQESVTAYANAVEKAKALCNDSKATYVQLEQAVVELNAACSGIVVNKPADDTRYTLTLNQTGFKNDGRAVTYIAGEGNSTMGGYTIGYYATTSDCYAQAFLFTPVDGKPNCYYLSQKDKNNEERYLCTSYTGYGSSGNLRSIRTTTDKAKALCFQVIPSTTVEGKWKLLNTEYTSGNGYMGSYDYGVYTEIPGENKRRPNCTDFRIEPARKHNANMTVKDNVRWGTFMAPFTVTIPKGVTAYTVNSSDVNNELVLNEITGTIPALQPVVVHSETAVDQTFSDYANCSSQSGNLCRTSFTQGWLCGTLSLLHAPDDSYVLQKNEGVVGFYRVQDNGVIRVGQNRAYLTSAAGTVNAAKMFILEDQTTGIFNILSQPARNAVYDLTGRVANNPRQGIFIQNNKKFIIR